MEQLKIVFTGGGTGGHVYPNIAIYEAVKEKYPQAKFLYIGTRRGAEKRIVEKLPQPMDFVSVRSKGLPQRVKSLKSIPVLFEIFLGAVKSFKILRKFKPHVVVGSGGYVAAPVLLAAAVLKCRVFVHEQNAVPGRMNRFIARFATRIGVSFSSSVKYFPSGKAMFTGYPLRRSIEHKKENNIRQKYNIPAQNKILFVFGGSGGARSINQVMVEILPMLMALEDLTVILATGRGYSREYKAYDDTVKRLEDIRFPPEISGRLIIREYFDNIDEIYSIADLIIARAGAGTIKEITTVGIPSILIPKINLPGDHQILNAMEVQKMGGARVVFEEISRYNGTREIKVAETALFKEIRELLFSEKALFKMRVNLRQVEKHDSSARIVEVLETIIQSGPSKEEKQIKVFYLQSGDSEKSHELIFDSTTVGNTLLSDIYLDALGPVSLFSVRQINRGDRLILKPLKGSVQVNGKSIQDWCEIAEGDLIEIGDLELRLKSYSEKVTDLAGSRTTASKMMGSSLGIVCSRLGGFVREIVTAAYFGAGKAMDIFAVGLTISNFMRRIVAENALDNAFLPIFMRLFHRSPRKKTWEASSSIVNVTVLLSLLFMLGGILLAPLIIRLLYPGFAAKGMIPLTVKMTRLMFPYLLLVTIAAVMASMLKAFNRFGLAESSAIFFSVGTIFSILIFYNTLGIFSLAAGVLLGGLLQIVFLLPFTLKVLSRSGMGFSYRPKINFTGSANKKYYAQLAPISADVFLSNTSELVNQFLASGLASGSIAFLYFARRIFSLPFAIISQAVNSVILREFSSKIALFDKEKARKLFTDGISINLFLLTPVSILMIIMAEPIVSVLLQRSSFSASDVSNTAYALQFYSLGLVGWGIHSLTVRIFSARLDIKTSMKLNFFMLLVNVALCILLVKTALGFAGLALATSISYLLFTIIRISVLRSRLMNEGIAVRYGELLLNLGKTLGAAGMMVIVLLETNLIFNKIHFSSRTITHLVKIVSLSFIGIAVYFLVSLILKNTEIFIFKKKWIKSSASIPVSMLSPFGFLNKVAGNPDAYAGDYSYKVNIYTSSSNWEIRNVGVKLAGLFKDRSKISMLTDILRSRKEKGFVRRNAVISLTQLKYWDQELLDVFSGLLNDSYYEVRVAALKHLAMVINTDEYKVLAPQIRAKLKNGLIEEKLAAVRVVSVRGNKDDLRFLESYYLSANSLLREALIELFRSFYRRDILDSNEIKERISRVLITSNNLDADFKLKALIRKTYKEIE